MDTAGGTAGSTKDYAAGNRKGSGRVFAVSTEIRIILKSVSYILYHNIYFYPTDGSKKLVFLLPDFLQPV